MKAEDIDRPEVIEQVTRLFERYEEALMGNDLAALDAFFWRDERLTRYGIADRQWGIEALRAHRTATPAPTFTRRLEHLRIHAYGPDCAVAQVEFVRSDTTLRGFQTQTWVRLEGVGWRIVAAHVSMIAFDD
jgi:hypothetical protein